MNEMDAVNCGLTYETPRMKVPNLLDLVREKLQDPAVRIKALSDATEISYDTIWRIKTGTHHDPGWSVVWRLACILL